MTCRRLVLEAYGRTVELVAEESVLKSAGNLLPSSYELSQGEAERSWAVRQGHTGDWTASADDAFLGGRATADEALETAVSHMELWVVEHTTQFVAVHAGCVAVQGAAIVLPGRPRTGKTTMVEALSRAGASYFSDEFAMLDNRGLVHPYHRPLALRRSIGVLDRPRPEDLGFTLGRNPARVALVAALEFSGAAGWKVNRLTRSQTILRLLENTVPAQLRPVASLDAIGEATGRAVGVAGTRGEADDAVHLFMDILAA